MQPGETTNLGPLVNDAKGRCFLCDVEIDDAEAHFDEYHPIPQPAQESSDG